MKNTISRILMAGALLFAGFAGPASADPTHNATIPWTRDAKAVNAYQQQGGNPAAAWQTTGQWPVDYQQYGQYPYQGQYQASPYQGQYQAYPYQGQYQASPYQGQYQAYPYQGQYQAYPYQGQYQAYPYQGQYPVQYQTSPYASQSNCNPRSR